jgi:hypothetical protein
MKRAGPPLVSHRDGDGSRPRKAESRAGCSGAASRGAWRSWPWRSAASRASSAARAVGPAFQSRDLRTGLTAGAAGAMGWPGLRDAAPDDEAALASGKVDEALFDKTIVPLSMVGHGLAGA